MSVGFLSFDRSQALIHRVPSPSQSIRLNLETNGQGFERYCSFFVYMYHFLYKTTFQREDTRAAVVDRFLWHSVFIRRIFKVKCN